MKVQFVTPQYVEQLPEQLREGMFYICEEFSLTAHKCCCGCGEDVYNKLNPAKWRLSETWDGRISLEPSIGNWKYPCQSHYWIRNNRVIEAGPLTAFEIETVQQQDLRDRDRYVAHVNAQAAKQSNFWARGRLLVARTLRTLQALWPW